MTELKELCLETVRSDGDVSGESPVPRALPSWQRGVIYQIYPRSFADASGDGVGDLPGTAAHVGYLSWLGVDPVWLSPIYPSPGVDLGYDVADYCSIDPRFGTLADFDTLLRALQDKGIGLVLDFVPNHTSEPHAWFLDSRKGATTAHHDWYVWCEGRGGGPPNNWESYFGGPAWTYLDPPASSTCTRSRGRSPSSTGRTGRSVRRSSRRCGSGWTGAWTAFASTPSACSGSTSISRRSPGRSTCAGRHASSSRGRTQARSLPIETSSSTVLVVRLSSWGAVDEL